MKDYLLKLNVSVALLLLFTLSTAAAQTEPADEDLPNFHYVSARLYRGGQPKDGGIEHLKKLGVNTIINLRTDDARAASEGREALAAGMKYFNVPLQDKTRPSDEEIDKILRLINDPSNGVVFVHCKRGKDRTGTVIASYRILNEGWTAACAKKEAEHYGMSIFQFGMKRYINSFYERRGKPADPATKQTPCPAPTAPIPVGVS